MEQWWAERRWLRRHTMAAPFGIFAATMLLTLSLEQWQWPGPAGWDRAGGLVDLGAVFYGMTAVAVERSIWFMFWAWDQRQKVRAKLREEGRQKGLAEGRDEGEAIGLEKGEAIGLEKGEAIGLEKGEAIGQAATAQRYKTWLTKVAEEQGIELAELLPPDEDAPVC